ncbi:TetR/AcrR family transcriptional regulator [Aneurinibacillus migulanus]|uniref:TetR family transcriptional regulator n=1 Tax=Aneurinibacillus migulanus TaxID=47500 RepID=A0A0D1XYG5_ANEMI|nr:TetR/AcrR family transcriptional regulator [Aneurinibacillus migulanus]KIV57083.1 TetR family transcriptional regulator [Aneurinibacillus migulanus]KON93261.1 TetR family transcriptional regulator [Aneurinibacillus migulanus]MED0893044.1 TetR/AcrR family transcriptional regulator [Aneurinibacillus migulanus]MED1619289.1 TetR/AcrR family transcriptional regulator [Aneurinibacillus migulanus]CEH32466.1 Transcriptional regulator, TetR family [Aneurinibacillus migulanus]
MAKPNIVSKQELLASAKKCLAEHGIEKLTLKAVAAGAGVTQGTVYYHFRTKEQLMLSLVEDVCTSSWRQVESDTKPGPKKLKDALHAARERCTSDSFYHRLFFSLMVYSFQHEEMKKQLHDLLSFENKALSEQFASIFNTSPVEGISFETWGILVNAMIDGLAVQALLSDSFPADRVYGELETLLTHGMTNDK